MPTGQLRGEIDVFKLGLLLRRSGLTPRGITMKYRPEIDGLRAVAVLPIIFFHAGFTWMSGGFVGVDVFFVISGYLITTIILNELDEGRFSIVQFYERRARRILPALFLVLGCCVPVATWLLLPDQLIGFSKSLASVISFLSNVYFRGQINYFARSSEEEPLLHTWSLAVEEQYYLLFPVLATLLWKSRRAGFFVATLLIALSSFLYADSQSLLQPDKAFFDTRMRVWELFIGSLVATYILRWRKAEPGRSVAEFGSALGLGMIVWACLNYVQSTPFPGRHALVPTIGVSDHVKLSKFGQRWSRPPTSHRSNPTPQASQLMPQIAHIIHWDSIPPYLRQYRYEIVERSDWSKRWQRRISKPPPRYRQHERSLDLVHCHLLIVPGPNQLSI